jgi:hypothetical protein
MNARAMVITFATALVTTSLPALAGPNDFFGGNVGGQSDSSQGSQSSVTAPPTNPPSGEYTVDEKRMQRKFKANVQDAQRLVAKAELMMRSADKKMAKKGKIMKEIGEKRIAELKANCPYPEAIANTGNKTH